MCAVVNTHVNSVVHLGAVQMSYSYHRMHAHLYLLTQLNNHVEYLCSFTSTSYTQIHTSRVYIVCNIHTTNNAGEYITRYAYK